MAAVIAMKNRYYLYPVLGAIILSTTSLLTIYPDVLRVRADLQTLFVAMKLAYSTLGYSLALYFFRTKQVEDLASSMLFLLCILYCLSMIWFLPLYEFAYVQCAIGAAFLKTKRKWIFPVMFGAGALGYLTTYALQAHLNWALPEATRKDWVLVVLVCFFLAWIIQRYAIDISRKEKEKILRLSRIGHETNRLLHDVKGMISSPLLIAESITMNSHTWSQDEQRLQAQRLTDEIRHVREMLRSINQISKTSPVLGPVCVRHLLERNLKVLARRLSGIEIDLPRPHTVVSDENILHSAFFNLLLNSIEAFEYNKTPKPKIEAWWEGSTLVYRDNAGTTNEASLYGGNSGLGLEILKTDLDNLGVLYKIDIQKTGMSLSMKLG